MIFAILLAIAGLTISAVAIYYSVIGLTAIFAAAFWPVVIMGTTLEAAKLVAAVWLKAEWYRIPRLLKTYLTSAVLILMVITSMGIFGFLSKAHLDQNIVSGDSQGRLALYDEKIANERDTIANARTLLNQMDKAVSDLSNVPDQEIKLKDGGTQIRSSAERALQVRRTQARDRENLTKQIEAAQARIVELQEERAPLAAEFRKIEAEVGPIKYIAKLIYGDNPDQNILEKAVTWVIILIVIVFDPLAVLLLISSQLAYQWHRQETKKESKQSPSITKSEDTEPLQEKEYLHPLEKFQDKNKEDEANAVAAENPPQIDVESVLDSVESKDEESKNLTVDTTQKTVDGADLYDRGKIEELSKELVEKFDDEKLEEDPKKKTSYMIKDQGQQIKKIKDQ